MLRGLHADQWRLLLPRHSNDLDRYLLSQRPDAERPQQEPVQQDRDYPNQDKAGLLFGRSNTGAQCCVLSGGQRDLVRLLLSVAITTSDRTKCPPKTQVITKGCASGYTIMPDGTCCNDRYVSADGMSCNTGRQPCPRGEFRDVNGACTPIPLPGGCAPGAVIGADGECGLIPPGGGCPVGQVLNPRGRCVTITPRGGCGRGEVLRAGECVPIGSRRWGGGGARRGRGWTTTASGCAVSSRFPQTDGRPWFLPSLEDCFANGVMESLVKLKTLTFVVGLILLASSAGQAQEPREQIEAIIRGYLLTDPDEVGEIAKEYLIKHPEAVGEILVEVLKRRSAAAANSRTSTGSGARRPAAPDRDAAVANNAGPLFSSTHQVTLGNPEGDVTLVEFFDYSCGYCKRALPDIVSLLNTDPKLKVVLKAFPILGPGSAAAARVAVAVRMQDPGGNDTSRSTRGC